MVKIGDLIVFLEAAESNHFSQTARKLGLSQPAISQKIKSLEDRFGIVLFEREGRSMRLTQAGQELEMLTQELVNLSRELEEKMAAIQDEVMGDVTISCSMTLGKYLLIGLIAAFRNQFPLVQVNITCYKKKNLLYQLSIGEIAFGLAGKVIDHRDTEYKKLFTDEIILVVPANHAWAKRAQIRPEDLLSQPIILLDNPAGTREVLFEALKRQSIDPESLNVALEFDNAESIVIAVEEGIGIAFISRLTAVRGLKLGKIKEVHIEEMGLEREIFIVRNSVHKPTQAQRVFWEFIGSQNEYEHLCSITGLACSVQSC
jgi:DNA-binding transcriptional LysR family regulator